MSPFRPADTRAIEEQERRASTGAGAAPPSRLDVGSFTAAEIQTMARFAGISVDKVRRLTECAVLVGKLERGSSPAVGLPPNLADIINAIRHDGGIDMIDTRTGHDVLGSELVEMIVAALRGSGTSETPR